MDKPRYYTPRPRPKAEVSRILRTSTDPQLIYQTAIDAANYEEDWRWLQRQFLDLYERTESADVRLSAIFGIQFLIAARGQIEPASVLPTLVTASEEADPSLKLHSSDALDDLFHKFPGFKPGRA